jgi:hypothetical protein
MRRKQVRALLLIVLISISFPYTFPSATVYTTVPCQLKHVLYPAFFPLFFSFVSSFKSLWDRSSLSLFDHPTGGMMDFIPSSCHCCSFIVHVTRLYYPVRAFLLSHLSRSPKYLWCCPESYYRQIETNVWSIVCHSTAYIRPIVSVRACPSKFAESTEKPQWSGSSFVYICTLFMKAGNAQGHYVPCTQATIVICTMSLCRPTQSWPRFAHGPESV